MIVNGRSAPAIRPSPGPGGGGHEGRPRHRRPLPPWAGRRVSLPAYFDGVMQSVNCSSPKTNVPQFPETDRSSKRFPGPNFSPTATV